jgi:hypothetical protein
MFHLFTVRMGSGREEFEPEESPTFIHLMLAWLAFLVAGLAGIFVGFLDAWFVQIGVIVAPVIAIAFLIHLKNAR